MRFGLSIKLLSGLVGGVLLFLDPPSAQAAARALQIRVERDGQVVLEAPLTDNGESDPAVVWSYLLRATLKPVGPVAADPNDPLTATLTGDLRVAVLHGTEPVGGRTQARVTELHLVRGSPHDQVWQLPAEEVDRTAKAAGLVAGESKWLPLVIACGLAGVVVGVMAAWFAAKHMRGSDPLQYQVAEAIPEAYPPEAYPEEAPADPDPADGQPGPHG